LQSTSSDLIILGSAVLGSPPSVIRGGLGGPGGACFDGGDGGDGLVVTEGSAVVSLVQLQPGQGGIPGGDDGDAYIGNVFFDDRFPFLEMTPAAAPGQSFRATISSLTTGAVILLAAGHGGFANVGGIGPPLSVLPGQWFFVLPAGNVSIFSPLTVTLRIPDDPVVRGVPINMQSVVVDALSQLFLSNAVTRVVGG
jgi:hypothetical protein